MRESLTKKQIHWLKEASLKWEQEGLIEAGQRLAIEERYSQKSQMTGLQFLLIIGGLLLGLGLLTMVTTSWVGLDAWVKGLLLAMTAAVFAGFGDRLEKNIPKTALGFYVVSLLVYSVGMLLINEISGARWHHYSLYPVWIAGVAAFLWVKRLPEIMALTSLLSALLVTVEMFNGIQLAGVQYLGYGLAIGLPVFLIYWNSREMKFAWLGNLNAILVFISVLSIAEILDLDIIYGFLVCFGLGFAMFYGSERLPGVVLSKWAGLNAIALFGFLLSFDEFWVGRLFDFDFGALLILMGTGWFFIRQLKSETWISGIWLIVFIVRIYFDTLFDVLPKGLFFIIGGLCLLVAGFLLERFRKGKLGVHHEE